MSEHSEKQIEPKAQKYDEENPTTVSPVTPISEDLATRPPLPFLTDGMNQPRPPL